jgi:hypothetical protein
MKYEQLDNLAAEGESRCAEKLGQIQSSIDIKLGTKDDPTRQDLLETERIKIEQQLREPINHHRGQQLRADLSAINRKLNRVTDPEHQVTIEQGPMPLVSTPKVSHKTRVLTGTAKNHKKVPHSLRKGRRMANLALKRAHDNAKVKRNAPKDASLDQETRNKQQAREAQERQRAYDRYANYTNGTTIDTVETEGFYSWDRSPAFYIIIDRPTPASKTQFKIFGAGEKYRNSDIHDKSYSSLEQARQKAQIELDRITTAEKPKPKQTSDPLDDWNYF